MEVLILLGINMEDSSLNAIVVVEFDALIRDSFIELLLDFTDSARQPCLTMAIFSLMQQ